MKVPISWLKQFINTSITTKDFAHKLTMSGLETIAVDDVLDVDILPNRGDCNSIVGVSREVAAISNLKLKLIKIKLKESNKKASSVLKVEVRDQALCPRYMARVVENVEVKDSPQWLQNLLIKAGQRPINNVVDITNFLLLELGQPMHAFDYDLIEGQKIIVRRASAEEKIHTLDKEERNLNKDALVISDQNRAIAVAGIMGAANTEVSPVTKTIVLESAYFDPINIAKTSKLLKHRTESSVRFEKSVDWDMVEYALDCAAKLLSDLAGGLVLAGKIDIKNKTAKQAKKIIVDLRIKKIADILGYPVSREKAVKILRNLGFTILKSKKDAITVEVPSWRKSDVEREIDLIEEIARIMGYDKIPVTLPKIGRTGIIITQNSLISKIKNILIGCGLFEVQTFSIIDPKETDEKSYKITNPMTISESAMRTSLIPSILKVVSHNLRHQVEDIRIFEVGKVFAKGSNERLVLAGAISHAHADFYDIKGIIQTLLAEFSAGDKVENINDKWFNPAKSARIGNIAKFGLLHPEMSKRYDFAKDVYIFEVYIEALLKLKPLKVHAELPKYPKVDRDIAMFVPAGINYSDIISFIKQTAGGLLEEVVLFDVYKNSQAYRLSFRDKNGTLTDEIVNKLFYKIIKELEDNLKVQIRK